VKGCLTVPVPLMKVAALVLRPGVDGPELLVFDHPNAGTQLPAGTGLLDEDPIAAARRELFEETGVDAIDQGRLLRTDAEADRVRHLVRFHLSQQVTAESWYVITPDGGGLCWRCRWLPLAASEQIVEPQRAWVDLVRADLVAGNAPKPAPALPTAVPADSEEVFWAPPHRPARFRTWWIPAHVAPPVPASRAQAVCVTGPGVAVVVGTNPDGPWTPPGGGLEGNEMVLEALAREVREEACAELLGAELLGHQVGVEVSAEGPSALWAQAKLLATVRLDPFEPKHEITHRRAVPLEGLIPALRDWTPMSLSWVSQAVALASRRVAVVPYDDSWPTRFEHLRREIHRALGDVGVEHVGSTSVPGLSAKPTIDLLVCVPDPRAVVAALEDTGFEYRPGAFPDPREHIFLRRLEDGQRIAHLHVLRSGADEATEYLLFRDWLRSHPDEAQAYAGYKLNLARIAPTRAAYVTAKEAHVAVLLDRIRAELKEGTS
jgi:GrpB-like predicted nucleotidyltransferase (UPF0157 family)/8-oxo-dGTP pyrophosphatase MutT (NUDIX family)